VPLSCEGIGTVTQEADKVQFSRQIWQAASEQAHLCLSKREFCPEQSRIENLRCVCLVDETEGIYGKQLWCFEAIGIDPTGRRHVLHGVLEFAIQYGLLEPSQSAMFDDVDHRESFLSKDTRPDQQNVGQFGSTQFWVYSAWCGIAVLSLLWIVALVNFLTSRHV